MRKNAIYTVTENKKIAAGVFQMRLQGPTDALEAPGQFVNLRLAGFYLRRPLSVCDWDGEGMTLVYKIMGRGTATMARYAPGTELDLLTGLGNGFSVGAAREPVVLAGGGVGVPPLYALAKALIGEGITPEVALGFRRADEVFYQREFEALGCRVHLATEDGSAGMKGFVTAPLAGLQYHYYYTCGPQAMLKAVWTLGKEKGADGQLSLEERMGCGFGACMGCSCQTKEGAKRLCVEGPVLTAGEVMWDG